jgi:hypothetical protein
MNIKEELMENERVGEAIFSKFQSFYGMFSQV